KATRAAPRLSTCRRVSLGSACAVVPSLSLMRSSLSRCCDEGLGWAVVDGCGGAEGFARRVVEEVQVLRQRPDCAAVADRVAEVGRLANVDDGAAEVDGDERLVPERLDDVDLAVERVGRSRLRQSGVLGPEAELRGA